MDGNRIAECSTALTMQPVAAIAGHGVFFSVF